MEHYVVLPYLKTSEAIPIRGIQFRSSKDLDSLPASTQQHFAILFSMFFLKDELRIKQMSCAYFNVDNEKDLGQLKKRLSEVHQLLAFLYSSPHPTLLYPFLKEEHANLYTFTTEPVSQYLVYPEDQNLECVSSGYPYPKPDNRREMPGYTGTLNNESIMWITKGSRIYPPSGHFWLNLSQDLYPDLLSGSSSSHGGGVWSLLKTGESRLGPIEDRIFIALKWYNRSNSICSTDEAALLHLAIAFESLLSLEQAPQITQRFKESVRLLVGPVPKLENWADQFYNARSRIVHEGSGTDLAFYSMGTGSKLSAQYRSLSSLGRSIFRICLNAVVAGADLACKTGLASLLITNQERFENICKALNNVKSGSSDALLSLRKEITDIDEYKFVPEDNLKIDTMLTANRLAAQYLISKNSKISPELLGLLANLAHANPSSDHFQELEAVVQIADHIGAYGSGQNTSPTDDIELIFSLARSVHHYTFMRYYALKEQREKEANTK
jgi:hypothetical protein